MGPRCTIHHVRVSTHWGEPDAVTYKWHQYGMVLVQELRWNTLWNHTAVQKHAKMQTVGITCRVFLPMDLSMQSWLPNWHSFATKLWDNHKHVILRCSTSKAVSSRPPQTRSHGAVWPCRAFVQAPASFPCFPSLHQVVTALPLRGPVLASVVGAEEGPTDGPASLCLRLAQVEVRRLGGSQLRIGHLGKRSGPLPCRDWGTCLSLAVQYLWVRGPRQPFSRLLGSARGLPRVLQPFFSSKQLRRGSGHFLGLL